MGQYELLRKLIEIDSPAGATDAACEFVRAQLAALGYEPALTGKGAVRCPLGPAPRIAVAAHVDTLGAVVCRRRTNGTLRISPVGGLQLDMVEGEYVRVRTLAGRVYTGTFLLDDPSVHANRKVGDVRRSADVMHVRLDEEVDSRHALEELGIRNGDVVTFDARYQELPSGYIKARHLDDKAGCFALLEVARRLREEGREVAAELFFSNAEEVGHGGTCGYSPGVEELLVVDMGVVGKACDGDERKVSICAKDSSGPYDRALLAELVRLAETGGIPHAVDVYPHYGSDGSVALRAGHDFRVGLIGPGVAASHGVERTHTRGIEATVELTLAFLEARAHP